ncbi:MAG TPA: DsbA family protein [Candidatus Omnitrophota bacterium]|nr:DsbA family protein [Candidatus Omnitrophota bacterium]
MIRKTLAAALLTSALALTAGSAHAQKDQTLSPEQADAVRKVVRDYLMEHPEVIVDAMEALREKMNAQAETEAKKAIAAHKEALFNGKDDPVGGNLKGDVTVVEFFDYNCGYCKVVLDPLAEAVKTDRNVKVVYKEFPILSADSATASRVALAAKKQGKYEEVHRAFMKFRGKLDEKTIFRLAGEAGANVDQLKKEMMAPEIDAQIKKNVELAHALNIGSTPTFVVGDRILPGAMEGQVFKQLFDITRKGGRLDGGK